MDAQNIFVDPNTVHYLRNNVVAPWLSDAYQQQSLLDYLSHSPEKVLAVIAAQKLSSEELIILKNIIERLPINDIKSLLFDYSSGVLNCQSRIIPILLQLRVNPSFFSGAITAFDSAERISLVTSIIASQSLNYQRYVFFVLRSCDFIHEYLSTNTHSNHHFIITCLLDGNGVVFAHLYQKMSDVSSLYKILLQYTPDNLAQSVLWSINALISQHRRHGHTAQLSRLVSDIDTFENRYQASFIDLIAFYEPVFCINSHEDMTMSAHSNLFFTQQKESGKALEKIARK